MFDSLFVDHKLQIVITRRLYIWKWNAFGILFLTEEFCSLWPVVLVLNCCHRKLSLILNALLCLKFTCSIAQSKWLLSFSTFFSMFSIYFICSLLTAATSPFTNLLSLIVPVQLHLFVKVGPSYMINAGKH